MHERMIFLQHTFTVSPFGEISGPALTLRQGTRGADVLVFRLPENLPGGALRLEARLKNGESFMTEVLPVSGGEIRYVAEEAFSLVPGSAFLQLSVRGPEGEIVWKSAGFAYTVTHSVLAEKEVEAYRPSWLDQLDAAVANALAAKNTLLEAVNAEAERKENELGRAYAEEQRTAADGNRNQAVAEAKSAALQAAGAFSDMLAMLGVDIATLGPDGKLSPSQIPPIAINDTFPVPSISSLLLLPAKRGDVAVIIESGQPKDSYILAGNNPALLSNWQQLGISYVAEAGHAQTASSAENASRINGKRLVSMVQSQYETAFSAGTLDENAYYVVTPDEG